MLKKESQGALKQFLLFLMVVAGVSLVIKMALAKQVDSYFEVFSLMYQFSLLFFGASMGLTLFLSDKSQHAEDYVLSLPYSRLQLLGIKVLPRSIAMVIYYLLFLAIYLVGGEGLVSQEMFFSFSWLYWLLFFMGLSFSASADSYMKVGGIALLGTFVYLQLFYLGIQLAALLKGGGPPDIHGGILVLLTSNFSRALVPFLVVCGCLLLPYLISFVFTYKKWGTYSTENYNKGYFKLFIPLIAAGFILSSLFIYAISGWEWHEYYLTTKHQLVATNGLSTRLLEAGGHVKLKYPQGYLHVFFEDERYVYGMHMVVESKQIVRIDKENYTVDMLLKVTRPGPGYSKYGIRIFKQVLVVPDHYDTPTRRELVFIDTRSKKIKRIGLYDILPANYFNLHIIGADADTASGKIFWLIASERSHQFPVFKLWEDGKAENLGVIPGTFPVYINRMLITTTREGLVVRRVTSAGLEVVREVTGYKQLTFTMDDTFAKVDLNPSSSKDIYLWQWVKKGLKNYLKLNLETFEISHLAKIVRNSNEYEYVLTYPGIIYKIRFERGDKEIDTGKPPYYLSKIYRLEGERFALLKEFLPPGNLQKGDNFWMSRSGLVIQHNNKLTVYTLPKMEPLDFKK